MTTDTGAAQRLARLRLHLTLLVAACVLPLAALAALLILDLYRSEEARLIADTVSQARALSAAVDREFASTQAALRALAGATRLGEGDLRNFHAQAVDALKDLHADSIVILDIHDRILLSTRRPYGDPLPSLPGAPLLRRMLGDGKPGVSDLFLGPVTGGHVVAVGVPVRHGGTLVMTLDAIAAPTRLDALLESQHLPPSWRAAIADSSGQVVASSHDGARPPGRRLGSELLRRLELSDEDSFTARGADGAPELVVYSRSVATRWSVLLDLPMAQLTAGPRAGLASLVLATLGALAAGLALAWKLGPGIAASVEAGSTSEFKVGDEA